MRTHAAYGAAICKLDKPLAGLARAFFWLEGEDETFFPMSWRDFPGPAAAAVR